MVSPAQSRRTPATPTSPMSLNMQIMQSRTSDAVAKWAATQRVVPVKDAITHRDLGFEESVPRFDRLQSHLGSYPPL